MQIQKFVKKPIVTEAVKLTEENVYEVLEWASTIQPVNNPIMIAYCEPWENQGGHYSYPKIEGLSIPTKEGNMLCALGDFLIKEPFPTDDRMFYPCKPDMHAKTYDEIK